MPAPQQIPRPPNARPGGSPPWAGATVRGITLARVRSALRTVGPADPMPALPYDGAPAAVLIPLFEEGGEARVILTRRSPNLRTHTHQVSFPGGRLDDDESPLDAALREASEEIGLDTASVDILGQLPPLATLSRNAHITPFVGALAARPVLSPNPHEVEHVFDVALVDLLSVYEEERWDLPMADDRPMHFFYLADDIVWGATARMLYQLLELVALSGRRG
ncbi:MAG: CoA pyrophosphatase [Actinomycetota bacterium]|nr:CoA pyrophosphatase [Actinomycetota bacterium]